MPQVLKPVKGTVWRKATGKKRWRPAIFITAYLTAPRHSVKGDIWTGGFFASHTSSFSSWAHHQITPLRVHCSRPSKQIWQTNLKSTQPSTLGDVGKSIWLEKASSNSKLLFKALMEMQTAPVFSTSRQGTVTSRRTRKAAKEDHLRRVRQPVSRKGSRPCSWRYTCRPLSNRYRLRQQK